MRQYVRKIFNNFLFIHLRRLRQWVLYPSSRQRFVSAFILSRIDFCNAVLAGRPPCMLAPRQLALNAAALIVAGLPERTHITDTLRSLHWLPVAYRIRYQALSCDVRCLQRQ